MRRVGAYEDLCSTMWTSMIASGRSSLLAIRDGHFAMCRC